VAESKDGERGRRETRGRPATCHAKRAAGGGPADYRSKGRCQAEGRKTMGPEEGLPRDGSPGTTQKGGGEEKWQRSRRTVVGAEACNQPAPTCGRQ
jgi:hypothetical protein